MAVLTLDFAHSRPDADASLRKAFYKTFVDALSTTGFVKLYNHGIEEALIQEAFEWAQRFFVLPEELKVKAIGAENSRYRGFIRRGAENAQKVNNYVNGAKSGKILKPDIKASFLLDSTPETQEVLDIGSDEDTVMPNAWIPDADLPGFHAFMNRFYEVANTVLSEVLTALEYALEIPPETFTSLTTDKANCLRLNYYPICDIQALQNGARRVSSHQDSGIITLLFQDAVGGLEIEDGLNPGTFMPVPNVRGSEFILNIGETMQRWTNDRLRSTSHQVTLPRELLEADGGQLDARYSIAFFGKANRAATAGSLPEFLRPGEKSKYKDITAWECLKHRTDVLYS